MGVRRSPRHRRRSPNSRAGFDQLETLVHERSGIDRDLAAHHPVGMRAGFRRRHARELFSRRIEKRSARSRKNDPPHALRTRTGRDRGGEALEDGVVLAVDRDELAPLARAASISRLPGHHQRFLVGEQQALAGARRCKGRQEARRTHDGRHDCSRLCGQRAASSSAGAPCNTRVARPATRRRSRRRSAAAPIHQHGDFGAMLEALFEEPRVIAMGGQRDGSHLAAMARDDIERAHAHAAGRAEDGDALHSGDSIQRKPSRKSGAAAVTLSMRSSTPPWPGNTEPLSFRPA